SQQIQALERQLGLRLFERHPKGVRLTDAGRAVIEQTRRLRDAWFSRRLAELSPTERASLDAIVPLLRRLAEQ
ncbi:MAG: LysR family transcriptional regulator, partial [Salinibacterium sp.]|nr:LysR family transcriptional regulator [Salinibacterium sp.]